jgi:hypothetical protein
MTLQEFVNTIARRTNHQIGFESVPSSVAGLFCKRCFDDTSELIPIHFNNR